MVIIYEDSNKAVRALYTLRESKYEDKHLLGKVAEKTGIRQYLSDMPV